MAKVLGGIRMLDVSTWHNGTAGGYMLADLGAEVVKVEPPAGDPYRTFESALGGADASAPGPSPFFESANRGKKSVIIDLTTDEGRAVFYRLVEVADVFHTNYTERVLNNLHIDWPTLRARNPRLIYARATGYGSRGPLSKVRGFDTTTQARSGIMWAVGDRDHDEPWQVAGGIFDQFGATMIAHGVVLALLARERYGIGQYVECSILGGAMHLQGIAVNQVMLRGRPTARHSRQRSRNPLSNQYRCADGKWLMLAEPRPDLFWNEFCTLLGLGETVAADPRFSTAAGRRANYLACNELLAQAFLTKSRDQWLAIFDQGRARFAYAPIYELAEAVETPDMRDNEYITEYDHPQAGRIRAVGFPVYLSETPAAVAGPAPELGQHTREILSNWLDYGDADVTRLEAAGICRRVGAVNVVG